MRTTMTRVTNSKKIRRDIIFKRRLITICVLASIMISIFLFLSYSFNSDASNNTNNKQYRYYASVSICNGDSVWSIAEEHMDDLHYRNTREFVTDIAHINQISPDAKLKEGTNIIVPYYAD
ncbi:LysM peptidoglycan-binding domain-containing protein [Butyrivibrio sp. AE3004]|uniref:LysM peptidoglycan-binding domain-containing protein n=1 Tax=Butyrivibrio sp. AE3004 TaxID=1506994 RepID=UPI000494C248|nr:LysM peptidoglycan-binding domain-containing protein [Butyrivibrio sp. AE3004]